MELNYQLCIAYFIPEEFPAVTLPPFSLKAGRNFLNFAASN